MADRPYWFAPRRYGYGAGPPITWQGWTVTLAYLAIVFGLALWLVDRPFQLIAALVPPTIGFLVLCARTTRGGWRWRWGDDD